MLNLILILAAAFSIQLPDIDTRVGTAAANSPTASIFGANGEVLGQCVPCVTEPNGMTGWTAQTRISEVKGTAPYYYSDKEWLGFRASHWLTGSAVQDYGTFYILPGGKGVPLDHSDETATPGYYRFKGNELTALSRSAIMRMDCDEILVGIPNRFGEGEITAGGNSLSAGNPIHRFYAGSGKPAGYSGWIYMEFSRPVEKVTRLDSQRVMVRFGRTGEPLLVKAGTSFTSSDAARANLGAEIPGWDFDAVRAKVEAAWNRRLSQIDVEGGGRDVAVHFYTSLWRTSLNPRTVSDFGQAPDFDDFSMWDTFRALHPLLTILHPELDGEMMQALVRKYERGGWLPIFPLWGSYTCAMIGDHCISVLADAYTKGIRNFDVGTAWKAVRQNCFETPSDRSEYLDGKGRRALETYISLGYVPLEEEIRDAFHRKEQASRTLEYAYDDWCASLLAKDLGTRAERKALRKRAGNWKNVFDPRTLYPQGRRADGTFLDEPGNYLRKTSFITEGTPCHYSWFVPHDVDGLVKLLGKDEFEARLDSMFTQKRYWHGNEPCHQVAYLYDYIGRPEKTQAAVSEILRTEYRNTPGGLSGNDDAGQMSAWYVFSSLGLYSVCPGAAEYALGIPAFDRATVHLENGKDFTVERTGRNGSFRWNGKPLKRPFISHEALMRGGTLTFE